MEVKQVKSTSMNLPRISLTYFLVLLTLAPTVHAIHGSKVTVSAPWGKLRGLEKYTDSDLRYLSFEGVPYAKPPVGNLRFAKPEPSVGNPRLPYIADAIKPFCYSMGGDISPSEDCLYLDMYVPTPAHAQHWPKPQLPKRLGVMVFIHGGGFISHSGNFTVLDPMEKGEVIVVVVHYRLGAFGFLSSPGEGLLGNYGLWDQRMALKWVKENVIAFGGDPDNISIIGHSAGSASVSYQALAPPSKNLFKRAIMLSGTATSVWALQRKPSPIALELASKVLCAVKNPWGSFTPVPDLLTCLRSRPAPQLHKAAQELHFLRRPSSFSIDFMFVPVVDGEFVVDEPARLLNNVSFLKDQEIHNKDFIIGVVNNEGSLMYQNPFIPQAAPEFGFFFVNELLPLMLNHRYGHGYDGNVISHIFNTYNERVPVHLIPPAGMRDAYADIAFIIPSIEFAKSFSNAQDTFSGRGKTFFDFFDYCPSFSPKSCMMHGLDGVFIFPPKQFENGKDAMMSNLFINLITSFVNTGNPTDPSLREPWPQFSKGPGNFILRLAPIPTSHQDPFPVRRKLWFEDVPQLMTGSL